MSETLPDIHLAVRTLLLDQTRAGKRVSTALPENPPWPFLTYRRDGGPPAPEDNRLDVARIVFESWGGPYHRTSNPNAQQQAYGLALEVRAVMLPPENVVGGFYGVIGGVSITGVRPDAGPSQVPDEFYGERFRQSFLVTYT